MIVVGRGPRDDCLITIGVELALPAEESICRGRRSQANTKKKENKKLD